MAKLDNELPEKVISLFVINENEENAVGDMLEKAGWKQIDYGRQGGRKVKFTHAIDRYERSVKLNGSMKKVWLDLVSQSDTSNLPIIINTIEYFDRLQKYIQDRLVDGGGAAPKNYAVLYGCAGAIVRDDGSGTAAQTKMSRNNIAYTPPVGNVVMVKEATWAENGEWVTRQSQLATNTSGSTQGGGLPIDVEFSKTDRFNTFRAKRALEPGLKSRIIDMNIDEQSALCFDKVIKIDMSANTNGLFQQYDKAYKGTGEKKTVRQIINDGGYDLIDMESYGFFISVPPDIKDVLILRVLTDSLDSKNKKGSDTLQQDLLLEHAEKELNDVIDIIVQYSTSAPSSSAGPTPGPAPTPTDKTPTPSDSGEDERESGQKEAEDSYAHEAFIIQMAAMAHAQIVEVGFAAADVATMYNGKLDYGNLNRLVALACTKLSNVNLSALKWGLYDELSAIIDDLRDAQKKSYSSSRFIEYADYVLRQFDYEGVAESDLDYAQDGWRLFCQTLAPTGSKADWRRYATCATRSVERVLIEEFGLANLEVERGGARKKNEPTQLIIRDKQASADGGSVDSVPLGSVFVEPYARSLRHGENAELHVWEEADMIHIEWNGSEDDGNMAEGLTLALKEYLQQPR